MSFPFNVGDRVVVKPRVNDYSITTPGSEGIIIYIGKFDFKVRFTKVTSSSEYALEYYSFNTSDYNNFALIDLGLDTSNKYYKVIRKIKEMEQKRKEQGYAY